MYFYARGYLGDGVLTKVDRATMAVGLEARAPLLDTRVVEFACRLDPGLRMRGLTTKYLLKRAMRGLLPDAILDRKKQGFAMPIGAWLRDELRPLLEDTLSERRLAATGLLAPKPIRRLVDEHVRGRADHRKPLWTLLAFMLWGRF
jgi:asparagine synthase (glutamine-hydrolysing)